MDQDNLPPGFRFHPTDEELITYYLNHKISDFGFSPKAIADVDLNKCEPWDLPDKAKMGEKEWYFFNLRDRKYPTGLRTNRATESGYWKTTGKDKEIFHCGAQVGMKKTLVFYKGRAPRGEKTNWVMHEYRHQTKSASKEEWVVCRVFRKSSINKKPMTMSSQSLSSLLDSPSNTTSAADLADMDMSAFNNMLTPPPNTTNNTNDLSNNKLDLNMYMNWIFNRDASINQHPLLSWSNGSIPNLPTSSSILRGLQLSGYPQILEGVDTTTACPSSSNVADINNPSIWRNY